MKSSPKVEIGVACSGAQKPAWWSGLMTLLLAEQQAGVEIGRIHAIGSALPDHNRNHLVDDQRPRSAINAKRYKLTDANRQAIASGFLSGDSEWLWFVDDDTLPPMGALSHLLSLGREAVAGMYHMPKKPYYPIAYMRQANGTYAALWDFPNGMLVPVDSVGMGCTLLHRSVFEQIKDEFTVYMRPNGTLYPVHRSRIGPANVIVQTRHMQSAPDEFVSGGYLVTRIETRDPDDKRPFPFFAMEYGRTEDHYFWELAAQVGIHPWLDTALHCEHIKDLEIGIEDFAAEHTAWKLATIEGKEVA